MALVALALDHQAFEHPLLMRIRVNVEPDERDAERPRRGPMGTQRALEPLAAVAGSYGSKCSDAQ